MYSSDTYVQLREREDDEASFYETCFRHPDCYGYQFSQDGVVYLNQSALVSYCSKNTDCTKIRGRGNVFEKNTFFAIVIYMNFLQNTMVKSETCSNTHFWTLTTHSNIRFRTISVLWKPWMQRASIVINISTRLDLNRKFLFLFQKQRSIRCEHWNIERYDWN